MVFGEAFDRLIKDSQIGAIWTLGETLWIEGFCNRNLRGFTDAGFTVKRWTIIEGDDLIWHYYYDSKLDDGYSMFGGAYHGSAKGL